MIASRVTELVAAEWRRTGWGGITHPIALQRIGSWLKVVKPVRREFSRTYRHGSWYYFKSEVDALLYLEQSNSGKRSVRVSKCKLSTELCKLIEEVAGNAWLAGAGVQDVERILETLEVGER